MSYSAIDARYQTEIDKADAAEEWILNRAAELMDNLTDDELGDVMAGMDGDKLDGIIRRAFQRDAEFRMAAYDYCYKEAEQDYESKQ